MAVFAAMHASHFRMDVEVEDADVADASVTNR
jgi:hypothetical protein